MAVQPAIEHHGLGDLSSRFHRFAIGHALPSSPLYAEIALNIAEDPSILRLARHAASTPVTNLFFGAVHHLLLSGADHELRTFYPNLTADVRPREHAFDAFRSFCHAYDAEIADVLISRRVQTNEVRRCLYLALGLEVVARETGSYSVVDVGSSAGLHLLWPRFAYHYEGHRLGDAASPVQLTCRFAGPLRPSFPVAWSSPLRQIGIDLNPLDPTKPEDQIWLRALVWPEHVARADLLERALRLACGQPPQVIAGDALSRLPELVRDSPPHETWCVCHNHTLNQFAEYDRVRFDRMLGELAQGRTIYRLSAEWIGAEKPEFTLSRYRDGAKSMRLLARVDDHGAWIEWAQT